MSYATDGLCHNAEPGTYGHECSKRAEWIGTTATGFASGYCDACKRTGTEARDCVAWALTAPTDRDATLTRFVRENVGRYSTAKGWDLFAWHDGPRFVVRAECGALRRTMNAASLAEAEEAVLSWLKTHA